MKVQASLIGSILFTSHVQESIVRNHAHMLWHNFQFALDDTLVFGDREGSLRDDVVVNDDDDFFAVCTSTSLRQRERDGFGKVVCPVGSELVENKWVAGDDGHGLFVFDCLFNHEVGVARTTERDLLKRIASVVSALGLTVAANRVDGFGIVVPTQCEVCDLRDVDSK